MFNNRVRDIIVGNILSFAAIATLLTYLELRVDRSLTRTTYSIRVSLTHGTS